MNPYSYIMNNPLAGTDPSGYSSEADTKTSGSTFVREKLTTGGRAPRSSKVSYTVTKSGGETTVALNSGTASAQAAVAGAVAGQAAVNNSIINAANTDTTGLMGQEQVAKTPASNVGNSTSVATGGGDGLPGNPDVRFFIDPNESDAAIATNDTFENALKMAGTYDFQKGKACITAMRDAYRIYFDDDSIGKGISPDDFTFKNLMKQLIEKGYVSEGMRFNMDDREISKATKFTSPIGTKLSQFNEYSIFAVGIGDGAHTMTFIKMGNSFSMFDQQTGWHGVKSSSEIDSYLAGITKKLASRSDVRDDGKSFTTIHKIISR